MKRDRAKGVVKTMNFTTEVVLRAAQQLVESGLSVLPISPSGNKSPNWRVLPVTGTHADGNHRRGWRPLQERMPDQEELSCWFGSWGPTSGVAVIGGVISGGLEAIDVDSPDHIEPWIAKVAESDSGLLQKLVLVQTPRPGLHAYYRHEKCDGSRTLAQHIVTNTVDGTKTVKTLIETRGQGGYAIIPPTPDYCHPSGRAYVYRSSRTLLEVQTISADERALLLDISKSFDQLPPAPPQPARIKREASPVDRRLPGHDFDARNDWDSLLEKHGWSYSHAVDEIEYWTRPGKSEGTSASVNFDGSDKLFVFTSEAHPLEQNRMYTKFEFLTFMEFEGDFKRAAEWLRLQGFGATKSKPSQRRRGRSTNSRYLLRR